jgi:hypothetical protein
MIPAATYIRCRVIRPFNVEYAAFALYTAMIPIVTSISTSPITMLHSRRIAYAPARIG